MRKGGVPSPITLTATKTWNIVESDVKHHKPNQSMRGAQLVPTRISNNLKTTFLPKWT